MQDCNCSICSKKGILHFIVPRQKFRLLTPPSELSLYTFNTGIAKHYFCRTCGIGSFYIPRSNPDGIDVNARCIDSPVKLKIEAFDGRNWEANAASLSHLSKDTGAKAKL